MPIPLRFSELYQRFRSTSPPSRRKRCGSLDRRTGPGKRSVTHWDGLARRCGNNERLHRSAGRKLRTGKRSVGFLRVRGQRRLKYVTTWGCGSRNPRHITAQRLAWASDGSTPSQSGMISLWRVTQSADQSVPPLLLLVTGLLGTGKVVSGCRDLRGTPSAHPRTRLDNECVARRSTFATTGSIGTRGGGCDCPILCVRVRE